MLLISPRAYPPSPPADRTHKSPSIRHRSDGSASQTPCHQLRRDPQLPRERTKDVQDTMYKYANREHINPPPFRVGDRVYVCTDHIRTNRTSRKLAEKKIGPFPIISEPFFTLRLPASIRIYPVFTFQNWNWETQYLRRP